MKEYLKFLLLVGVAASANSAVRPSPGMEFPLSQSSGSIDLGYFPDTETKTLVITLKNDLNENCSIDKAVSSCTCTVPQLEKQTIAPGESAKIPLTVSMRFASKEEHLKTRVAFETSKGIKILKLSGIVYPTLRIDRSEVEARRTPAGGATEFAPILIESLTPSELTNVSVECDQQRIEPQIEFLNKGKTALRLHLGIRKEALQEQRDIDDQVIIRFKHQGLPVKATVSAKLQGEPYVTFQPDRINVGFISKGKTVSGKVQISSKALGKNFVVEDVKSSNKDVQVKLSPAGAGLYTLSYDFTPSSESMLQSATRVPITCTTNDPAAHEAVVFLLGANPQPLNCCGYQTSNRNLEK